LRVKVTDVPDQEAMAIAKLKGKATIETVMPAIKSAINSDLLYVLMVVKIFGWRIVTLYF